jgi:hypothetical protein
MPQSFYRHGQKTSEVFRALVCQETDDIQLPLVGY